MYKIVLVLAAVAMFVSFAARADITGTSYIHKGKEISKFEALRVLLESKNKETVVKCQEQYIDERRGTLKNK